MSTNRGSSTTSQKNKNKNSIFVVVQEVFYLLLISFLSIATAVQIDPIANEISGTSRESFSSLNFLVVFFAMTLFVLFLVRSVRGSKLLGALFALAILTGISSIANVFFGSAVGVLAFCVGALIYYTNPRVIVFNLIMSFGLAGVAAVIGSGFNPVVLVVVLVSLSIYDVIAVYFTKHMVKLARLLLQRKVFFAMILPASPENLMIRISKVGPRSDYTFLGTGDLVLPALFLVSIASTQGIKAAVPVVIGAVVGFLLMNVLFLRQKMRRPMPALPPIVAGLIVGYIFTLFTR